MKFRYVGAESVPGSGRTKVFGNIDVAVGGVFDCPDHLIGRAKRHPHFEAVIDPHGTDITIGNQLPVIVADVRMMAPDDSKRDVTTVADITPSDVTVTSPADATAPRPDVISDDVTQPLNKADLIAKAEQFGVAIDRRWSAAKIAEAIIAR